MSIRSLFAPLFTLLLLNACISNETANSDTVKQSEIHQDYHFGWSGDAQRWTASATFRFGGPNGTTLHLVDPSEVKLNGKLMKQSKLLFGGAYYELDDDNYEAKNTFRFTDHDGKVYENGFTFEAIEFAENPKQTGKNETLEIALNREIRSGEGIKLSVEDTSATYSSTIPLASAQPDAEVHYDAAKKKLVIRPAFFRTMADVPLTLVLEYSFEQELEQKAAKGGELSVSYTSRTIRLERRDAQ